MELKFFICPHCNKEITQEQLLSDKNNSHIFAEFKTNFEREFKQEQETKVRNEIKKQLQDELAIEFKNNLEKELLKKDNEQKELINNLEKNFELKSQEVKSLTESFSIERKQWSETKSLEIKTEVQTIEAKLKNDYTDQIQKLKMDLEKKQNEIESIKNQLELQFQKDLNEQERKLNSDFKIVEAELNAQIQELKLANSANRLMNNKVKGENWEHEVESSLRKLALANGDEIEKITQAGNKADFRQIVKNDSVEVAKIIYECKNAEWKETWEPKLSQDMINEKAQYAILVATSTEEKFQTPFLVSSKNKNIFITGAESFELISVIVRKIAMIEAKANATSSTDERLVKFRDWFNSSFQTYKALFEKSMEGIEASEKTIRNKIDDIEKHRTKIMKQWQELILTALEGMSL
jgi:hypothetical protein